MTDKRVRRGQIWWADLEPTRGSEQAGHRPILVVSNDIANQHSSVVTIVPLTTKTQHKRFPQNVYLPANSPLPDEGLVLCGHVRTIDKVRLDNYRADLSKDQLEEVDLALAVTLGLNLVQ